ncbi:hypothetical protein ACFLYE_00600 [Chloroflexota bacterium]
MTTTEKKKIKVRVNPEKCTGCRVCQLECSFKYHKVFNPALSSIQILETPEKGISYVISYKDECRNCVTCVKACVFGALEIEEGGQ